MSIQALNWAWSVTTGSPVRKLILAAHANHAHADGTCSWAKPATIARDAECSARTVQRETVNLMRAGFLREGDQRHVRHLPRNSRPIVYDLAMSDVTMAQWAADYQPHTGRRAQAAAHGSRGGLRAAQVRRDKTGGDNVTPPAPGTSAQVNGGVTLSPPGRGDNVTPPGVTSSGTPGVTPVSPEPSMNPPGETTTATDTVDAGTGRPPVSPRAAHLLDRLPGIRGALARQQLATELQHRLDEGWTPRQLRQELATGIGSAASPVAVYRYRLGLLPHRPPADPAHHNRDGLPPKCPDCDPNRWRERTRADGSGVEVYRCPTCHPDAR